MTTDTRVDEGFEAITSLSRSVAGGARLPDVGPLLWVLLRQMVPCDAMALLGLDASTEQMVVRFAAGAQARRLQGISRPSGSGVAGWVAANRRSVLNAEPVFDLGPHARAARSLRSSVLVPLVDNGTVVAVLALYSKDLLAFTEEHVSILELLASRMALTLSARSTVAADDALHVDSRTVLHFAPRPAPPSEGYRAAELTETPRRRCR